LATVNRDLIIRLDLRGIDITGFNANAISDAIGDCCTTRDQMAHGIWVRGNGFRGLRLTRGGIESEEGYRSRAITPEGAASPPGDGAGPFDFT
jgi:hypothetical protein